MDSRGQEQDRFLVMIPHKAERVKVAKKRSTMSPRDELLDKTRRQVMKEKRGMERNQAGLIREITEGAKELRLFEEMKRLRNIKED